MSLHASIVGHPGRARAALAALLCALAACAGQKGADGGGSDEAPPGGSGTGANGVPVFWKVLGYGTVLGSVAAIRPTADGGWVGAGSQGSDVHVARFDGAGNLAWARRIPITGGGQARGIAELAAGGYVVAGVSNVSATETPFLLRLGADGTPLAGWPKTYGGGARGGASGVLALGGGADGFVAAGYRYSATNDENVWVLRTDAAGVPLWDRSDYADFCPGGGALATALAPVAGDLAVAGVTGCFGWSPILLRIATSDGAEVWRHAYDAAGAGGAWAAAVAVAGGEGFYVAGWRAPPAAGGPGPGDAFVLRTDAAGDETWRRSYGGDEADAFDAVAATSDGGFLAAGYTRSYGGPIQDASMPWQWEDVLLVRGTAGGETAWQKVKGLRPLASDGASAIALAADGGFAIGGWCGGNSLLAKFDAAGDTVQLGDRDLTYVIPAHEGTIRLATAVDAATAGAVGLTRPRQVGGTVLELLVATLRGEPATAFCTGGGTFGFTPPPAPPLVAPAAFALAFDGCVSGPAGDPVRLDGTASVAVSAADGDARTADYALDVIVEGLSIAAVPVGTSLSSTFDGSLRFERTASGGALAEVARSVELPEPGTLRCGASDGATTRSVAVGPFTVRDAVAAGGAIACGAAGDALTVDPGTGPLEVTVLAPLQLTATEAAPSAGAFVVRAPDGSLVTATVTAPGVVSLAVDTDGDGRTDGVLSVPWEYLED